MRVLITGASRGVGAALLSAYTARGDDALGTARGGHALGTARGGGDLLPLEVTDPESHHALAKTLGDAPLDTLVCNAGVYPDKGQRLDTGYPAEMWAQAFAVNVTGVFLSVQAMLPALRRAKAAKIAIISSQMASDTRAPGGSYIYRASKAAALNLGRNLAADLKRDGIAVGIYHPGWVRTDMGGGSADIAPDEAARGLVARIDALDIGSTGCFETWDGQAHPY